MNGSFRDLGGEGAGRPLLVETDDSCGHATHTALRQLSAVRGGSQLGLYQDRALGSGSEPNVATNFARKLVELHSYRLLLKFILDQQIMIQNYIDQRDSKFVNNNVSEGLLLG